MPTGHIRATADFFVRGSIQSPPRFSHCSCGNPRFFKLLFEQFLSYQAADNSQYDSSQKDNRQHSGRCRSSHHVNVFLRSSIVQHCFSPRSRIGEISQKYTGRPKAEQRKRSNIPLDVSITFNTCDDFSHDTHDDITQIHCPVHPRYIPDNSIDNAQNDDTAALWHFCYHQKIYRSAEQGDPKRLIESKRRVWSKRKGADKLKHENSAVKIPIVTRSLTVRPFLFRYDDCADISKSSFSEKRYLDAPHFLCYI